MLKALLEMKKHCLFACALIKKRRFWPTGVPGVAMAKHMMGKEVRSVDAIQGSSEGKVYNLWAMKEPDYVMEMMATGVVFWRMTLAALQGVVGLKEEFPSAKILLTPNHLTIISVIAMQ